MHFLPQTIPTLYLVQISLWPLNLAQLEELVLTKRLWGRR